MFVVNMKGLALALGLLLLAFAHADVSMPLSKDADVASTEGYAHGKRPEYRGPVNDREQPRYEVPGYGGGSYPPSVPPYSNSPGGYGYDAPHLRPAPVAQKLRNPDGPWNNNGQGGLDVQCVPLAPTLPAPDLGSPAFYIYVLGAPVFSGAMLLYETTINLNILSTNVLAAWNAISPYTATGEPLWPTPGVTRRPVAEHTLTNQNTAMLYAVREFTRVVLPPQIYGPTWNGVFAAVGLNITDASTDATTAVGIGNLAGAAAVAQYTSTKWNTAGDIGYESYQRPYADWTGFIPANTAYELKHPLLWQPLLETAGLGYFQEQTHTTPQAVAVSPLLASKQYFRDVRSPPPYPYGYDHEAYKAQADYILDLSASLTDAQKMQAEYYDDKATSFGVLTSVIAAAQGWNLTEFFLADMNAPCSVDASALMWREKIRHNAVRPMSAIRHIYEDSDVTAWVQNRGTQTFPGREWESYLRTMPHAEYPSGTACICAAFASFMRAATGTNTFPNIRPITFKAGCSRREPNLTPAQDTSITYATWDEFEHECSQTRAYAGVHFQSSIDEARQICAPLGRQCYQRAYKLFYGASSTPGPISSGP